MEEVEEELLDGLRDELDDTVEEFEEIVQRLIECKYSYITSVPLPFRWSHNPHFVCVYVEEGGREGGREHPSKLSVFSYTHSDHTCQYLQYICDHMLDYWKVLCAKKNWGVRLGTRLVLRYFNC